MLSSRLIRVSLVGMGLIMVSVPSLAQGPALNLPGTTLPRPPTTPGTPPTNTPPTTTPPNPGTPPPTPTPPTNTPPGTTPPGHLPPPPPTPPPTTTPRPPTNTPPGTISGPLATAHRAVAEMTQISVTACGSIDRLTAATVHGIRQMRRNGSTQAEIETFGNAGIAQVNDRADAAVAAINVVKTRALTAIPDTPANAAARALVTNGAATAIARVNACRARSILMIERAIG